MARRDRRHAEATEQSVGRRLTAWGLATFHAAGFVLVLLVPLYAAGGLGTLLQGLNTATGLALFGALWAASWLCTRQALRRTVPVPTSAGHTGSNERRPRLWVALGQGALWGGVNGVLFLLCLFGALLPVILMQGLTGESAAALGFYLAIGAVVALLLGAVVGVVFGAVDYALLALAESVLAPPASQRRGLSIRI